MVRRCMGCFRSKQPLPPCIKEKQSTESILTDLYLRAFSREPNDEEKKIAVDYFNNAKDKGQALEDIVWVAINRDEFLFQY